MDKNTVHFLSGYIVGALAALLVLIFTINSYDVWHKDIIEQGHGEYNRTTGEFQFLPACNKE